MNTKQIHKLISRKINAQIERLENVLADVSQWSPGEEESTLSNELSSIGSDITELSDEIDDNSFDIDSNDDVDDSSSDEDEEDDDVEELDAELNFDGEVIDDDV